MACRLRRARAGLQAHLAADATAPDGSSRSAPSATDLHQRTLLAAGAPPPAGWVDSGPEGVGEGDGGGIPGRSGDGPECPALLDEAQDRHRLVLGVVDE